MDKEIKRQLMLSGVVLSLLVCTLVLWYDNFVFHTYKNIADYQYYFATENEDIMIEGYELYKDNNVQSHGGARLIALKERFFLENDQIELTFSLTPSKDKEIVYKHNYTVKSENEVCYLDVQETKESLFSEDFKNALINMTITRDNKVVYEKELPVKSKQLVLYNGGNKDYTIENVFVSKSWLKTGDFSTKDKNLVKKYNYFTIDYLCLKKNGDSDKIDDYERFVHLNGKTQDLIDGKVKQSAYYDKDESLLDKDLICIVSLGNNEKSVNEFTFRINLSGSIQEGDNNV
ncbi:MAG: hypothetical protein RR630_02995 [Coprobacillus sp.]